MRVVVIAASICGLLLVAAGAAGAHLLAAQAIWPPGQEPLATPHYVFPQHQWDSALLYGFVHTLAALAAVFAPLGERLKLASAWGFIAGVVLFSGIQIGSILLSKPTGGPSPIDALSPLIPAGGIAFMAGWILLGVAAVLKRPNA
jgi:uncharacterized membrane protein YgdD (TMEM256/DUF423 family)